MAWTFLREQSFISYCERLSLAGTIYCRPQCSTSSARLLRASRVPHFIRELAKHRNDVRRLSLPFLYAFFPDSCIICDRLKSVLSSWTRRYALPVIGSSLFASRHFPYGKSSIIEKLDIRAHCFNRNLENIEQSFIHPAPPSHSELIIYSAPRRLVAIVFPGL